MKKIWQFIYYFWVNPGIIAGAHILAIFVFKVRKGLFPRYSTIKRLKDWMKKTNPDTKRILFHTASLGEFEHIRPLLEALKVKYDTVNIVSFFSPSGYNNVANSKGLDFHFYSPFDQSMNWKKIYRLIKPSLIIIAKHDVWPGQVWTAHKLNLPIYLINASLRAKSSRTRWGIKGFLKNVYRDFSAICAISDEDAKRFSRHYPHSHVEVVGDTKYDQVVLRKEAAQKQILLPDKWTNNQWIFMAGSIWPEDEECIVPALINILEEESAVRLVLVPHQPEAKIINRLKKSFSKWGIQLFSQREKLMGERVLIVDAIGYLAGLYNHAQAAYVGGSFHQGIHNVMEPAIFGIPVFFGPVHKNSYEAIQLTKNNGGTTVHNSEELYQYILSLIKDDDFRKVQGHKAEKFATKNVGATELLLSRWEKLLTTKNTK
jgi:3-deoxy-D-manno-octulosonic-acid transferase